jgi:hypothetical protein
MADEPYYEDPYPYPLPDDPTLPGGPEDPGEDPGTTEPPPPSDGPVDDPAAPDPWSTAPTDCDWQRWFLTNIGSTAATPEALAALEAKLTPHGIKVLRNAQGVAGKIQLPDGKIIDVGRAFSSGNPSMMGWQWLDDSAATTSLSGDPDWFDEITASMAPQPYATPDLPDYLQQPYTAPTWDEQFKAPTMEDLYADPGYKSRLDASQKGFERSAAAKGSILSGGTQKALGRYMQDHAANEYQGLFGRSMDQYQKRYDAFAGNAALGYNQYRERYNAYRDNVGDSLNQYGRRYQAYRDAIGDQFRLAELGYGATTAGAP